MNESCPFCKRIGHWDFYSLYREISSSPMVVNFEPLNPVVPGHMLFVPVKHYEHPSSGAVGTAMEVAANYAAIRGEDSNLIVSSGAAATQTVPHIHVHYVPRREGDGLHLPWTGQQRGERR